MTFIIKRGSFAKSTAVAPVNQEIDTGSGVEIKFLRVWTERQVGFNFLGEDQGHSEGWSDGTNHGSVSIGIEDNVGTSDAARRQTDTQLISCVDHDQSLLYEGTVSFGSGIDAGKFTIAWGTNNILADEIYYEAFCGNKIKNVKVGTFTSALVTGNQAITGVGFQGNYLNVWSIGENIALPNTDKDAAYSIGDAVSDSKRNGIAMYVDEGVVDTITTQTDLLIRTLEFAGMGGGATVMEDIDFVSFDADGWTHNMVVAKNQSIIYGYLIVEFEDVEVDIGDFLQPTTNSTVNVPTSNENVQEVKLRSQMRTATASIINDSIVKQMVGAGVYEATISHATTGFYYDHSGGTTDNVNSGDTSKIAKMFTAPSTLDGSAALVAQTVLSDFRLTWSSVDAVERELLYTAFSFDLQGNEWTNDGIVVDRFTDTFTLDAYLQETQTNAFDCDAILIATFEHTYDVEAVLKIIVDEDYTVDAILQKTDTDTFDTDAILVNRNTDTSTIDAFLQLETDLVWEVDANVQLATSVSYEIDAFLLEEGLTTTWTNDAFLEHTETDTYTLDGIAVEREIDTSLVDAILIVRKTDTSLVDSIISSRLLNQSIVDGNVALISPDESLVDAFLLAETDGDFNCDAILRAGFSIVWSVDAFLRELDKEFGFTLDAYLEEDRDITFINDAILSSRLPSVYTLDTLLKQQGIDHTWTLDAIMPGSVSTAFTTDAVIIMIENHTFNLDSILQTATDFEFTADAILSVLYTFDVDGYVQITKNSSWTNDAIISSRLTFDYSLDAQITGPKTLDFTVDANLAGATELPFTVDANVIGLTELGWSNDAILVERETFAYTLDALLIGPINNNFDVDAIITADGFFFWTIDAEFQATLEFGFSVDGLLPAETVLPFNLDAVVVSQPTFDFNLDAILGGPGLFFWAVDAILTLDQSCAFPDEDISNAGLWTPTPLWDKLNTLQCDGNFVNRDGHPDPAESFEVGLTPIGDPGVSTDHVITFAAKTDRPDLHFQARAILKQDGVTIIANTPWFKLESFIQNCVYELTPAEADLITNYMTLSTEIQTEVAKNFGTGFTGDAILV